MILADDSMKSSQTSALEQFVGSQAKNVQDLQVYGGASVVGAGVMNTLTSGFKGGATASESAAAGEQSQAAASSSEKAQSGSAASAATPASAKAEVRKEQ